MRKVHRGSMKVQHCRQGVVLLPASVLAHLPYGIFDFGNKKTHCPKKVPMSVSRPHETQTRVSETKHSQRISTIDERFKNYLKTKKQLPAFTKRAPKTPPHEWPVLWVFCDFARSVSQKRHVGH
jgi:hypothetical protein